MQNGRRLRLSDMARWAFAPVVLVGIVAGGCGTAEYIVHVTLGQLGIQGSVEPIEDVLESGRLTAEQEEKLRLILEIRQFGIDRLGLVAGESYTTYYDTSGNPLAFNLSAARKDALVPHVWWFPVVGSIPYLGFFDLDYARRVQRSLGDAGLDTFLYEVDAYSTLGLFADPVRSTMLERSASSLADTILHELLHNTVWRPGDVEFNESLATFVGRAGGIQFLSEKNGPNAAIVGETAAYYDDLTAVNEFLLELYFDLDAFFARRLSSEEKVAGREAVYQAGRNRYSNSVLPTLHDQELFSPLANLPTNNAWMLGNYRYNLDLELFEAVYATVGVSWPPALAVFNEAAASSGDSKEFLRNWLRDRGVTPPVKPANSLQIAWPPALEQYPVLALPEGSNASPRADETCRVRRFQRVWVDTAP